MKGWEIAEKLCREMRCIACEGLIQADSQLKACLRDEEALAKMQKESRARTEELLHLAAKELGSE